MTTEELLAAGWQPARYWNAHNGVPTEIMKSHCAAIQRSLIWVHEVPFSAIQKLRGERGMVVDCYRRAGCDSEKFYISRQDGPTLPMYMCEHELLTD